MSTPLSTRVTDYPPKPALLPGVFDLAQERTPRGAYLRTICTAHEDGSYSADAPWRLSGPHGELQRALWLGHYNIGMLSVRHVATSQWEGGWCWYKSQREGVWCWHR